MDTASLEETRRYVFASPKGVNDLANTIREPRIFLKLLGSHAQMRALLPGRWRLQSTLAMMTCDAPGRNAASLPPAYSLELSTDAAKTTARIWGEGGELAASGFAAEVDGVFVYDRIVVAPDHHRRGLGKALMAALGDARSSPTATQVLVATAQGQALYSALGWTVHSPYTTALIPDEA